MYQHLISAVQHQLKLCCLRKKLEGIFHAQIDRLHSLPHHLINENNGHPPPLPSLHLCSFLPNLYKQKQSKNLPNQPPRKNPTNQSWKKQKLRSRTLSRTSLSFHPSPQSLPSLFPSSSIKQQKGGKGSLKFPKSPRKRVSLAPKLLAFGVYFLS
jgi:hypothetical protein